MSIKIAQNDFIRKMKVLTPFQKLHKNVVDLGKIIVATGFENLPKCNKSPIWLHWLLPAQEDPGSNHPSLLLIKKIFKFFFKVPKLKFD